MTTASLYNVADEVREARFDEGTLLRDEHKLKTYDPSLLVSIFFWFCVTAHRCPNSCGVARGLPVDPTCGFGEGISYRPIWKKPHPRK